MNSHNIGKRQIYNNGQSSYSGINESVFQMSELYNEDQKVALTSKILNNNESVLNCLQFINLIQYYFNDLPKLQLNDNNVEELSKNNIMGTDSLSRNSPYKPFQPNCSLIESAKQSEVTTCFPCIVCSSQFSFEQTFHLHLERRSILIRLVYIIVF